MRGREREGEGGRGRVGEGRKEATECSTVNYVCSCRMEGPPRVE